MLVASGPPPNGNCGMSRILLSSFILFCYFWFFNRPAEPHHHHPAPIPKARTAKAPLAISDHDLRRVHNGLLQRCTTVGGRVDVARHFKSLDRDRSGYSPVLAPQPIRARTQTPHAATTQTHCTPTLRPVALAHVNAHINAHVNAPIHAPIHAHILTDARALGMQCSTLSRAELSAALARLRTNSADRDDLSDELIGAFFDAMDTDGRRQRTNMQRAEQDKHPTPSMPRCASSPPRHGFCCLSSYGAEGAMWHVLCRMARFSMQQTWAANLATAAIGRSNDYIRH
jgi:hypothetical protein